MNEFPVVAIHLSCGQPAFYMRRVVSEGGQFRATDCQLLSGGAPVVGQLVTCGSCGEFMALHSADMEMRHRD